MNADVEDGAAAEPAAFDMSDLPDNTGVICPEDVRRSLLVQMLRVGQHQSLQQ